MKDPNSQDDEEPKHAGGRPLKFASVVDLQAAINTYFTMCDPHKVKREVDCGIDDRGDTKWVIREVMTEQRPYLISGLARALGTTRETLLDYESGKYDDRDKDAEENHKFSDTIRAAKQRCEEYTEEQLYGPYAGGARFSLSNNFKGKYQPWSERQEIDHTTKGNSLGPMTELSTDELRRLAQEQDSDGGT